jgi:hypothetical protein
MIPISVFLPNFLLIDFVSGVENFRVSFSIVLEGLSEFNLLTTVFSSVFFFDNVYLIVGWYKYSVNILRLFDRSLDKDVEVNVLIDIYLVTILFYYPCFYSICKVHVSVIVFVCDWWNISTLSFLINTI